jgi:hypothetical protein
MVVLTAVLLSGCDTYHYVAGTIHEDARRPARAIGHYESFLAHRPKDPRACEVRLRTADIYRHFFGRCQEARRHYETAARDFPWMRACADRAKAGLLVCPDFFPTDPGRTWIYVDSASGGKAMRLEWSTGASSTSIQTALYAGNKRIQQSVDHYQKMDWAIWRVDGDGREAILRYPYTETLSWPAKRGKTAIEYLVVGDSVAVRSKAGAFSGCLKVRETDLRFKKSWKYDYYCPGVGRVKTTVGGPGFENPNTELLRYDGGLVELSR